MWEVRKRFQEEGPLFFRVVGLVEVWLVESSLSCVALEFQRVLSSIDKEDQWEAKSETLWKEDLVSLKKRLYPLRGRFESLSTKRERNDVSRTQDIKSSIVYGKSRLAQSA